MSLLYSLALPFGLIGLLLTAVIASPETWKSPKALLRLLGTAYLAAALTFVLMTGLLWVSFAALAFVGITGDTALACVGAGLMVVMVVTKFRMDQRDALRERRTGG